MTSRFWYLFSKKISGEAGEEELSELDLMIRENPEWAYSAGQVQKILRSEENAGSYDPGQAFEQHLTRLRQNGIELPGFEADELRVQETPATLTSKRNGWLQAAAVVFILISVAITWKLNSNNSPELSKKSAFSELQTKPGSKTRLLLPDSSIVWLNSGSKLTYNEQFGITNRNTTLTGEAFFEVKRSEVPFVIQTNDIKIKVLGTVFNVRSYPNEKTETSLLHGSVEITLDKRPGEKYLLKPNEKLVVSPSDAVAKEKKATTPIVMLEALKPSDDHTYSETSWVDNKLIFQDESFADLAVKMERWYGVEISIKDEKLAAQRLSGTFTTETIQEAMEALQLSTSFHYTLRSNLITVTR